MSNAITRYQPLHMDLAILLLRLVFGGLFIYHGYTKLIAFNEILPQFPDFIGIGAKPSFILLIFAELVCGFLVVIGWLTRLAVIPIFIAMIVAYFMAHVKDAFPIKELPFVFLCLSVVIFITGSGRLSADALMQKNRPNSPFR
jgi:putative oxidoreductase